VTFAFRQLKNSPGFLPGVGGMVMAGADGNAETVSRQWVSAGIFDVPASYCSRAGGSRRTTRPSQPQRDSGRIAIGGL